jgi:drug/metabolite transporter (DMT)-like permease
MGAPLHHRAAIVGAAALFSTGGAAIKVCGLSGWQVASFRSGVAAVTLALLVPEARRGITRPILGVGVAYAVTMLLFVQANKLTTAANTIFLQSTAPLWVLLFGARFLGEKVRGADLTLMAAIAAGLALFFVELSPASAAATDPFFGNLLAAGSGLSYAVVLLGLRWLARGGDRTASLRAVITGNAIAFVVALPLTWPLAASAVDLAVIGYLGVIQISLAYLLLTYGISRVPAFEASLLILVEPTLSPVWAWLFSGERPRLYAIAGGVLIIGATTLKTWYDQRVTSPGGRGRA